MYPNSYYISENIYKEIQKAFQSVYDSGTKLMDGTYRQKIDTALAEAADEMLRLANITRREGLLALEEEAGRLSDTGIEYDLKMMITYIVDGTEPRLVEDVCMLRYYSHYFTSLDRLVYLSYLIGILSIQAGENPYVTHEKLLALVSDDLAKKHKEEAYEERMGLYDIPKDENGDPECLTKLYQGDVMALPDQKDYYVVILLDYIWKHLTDVDIQRMLRDIENHTLEIAMKVLSGEARKRILDNLSKRLAIWIAEDMNFIGRFSAQEIAEACHAILQVYFKLSNTGELDVEQQDDAILSGLYRLFTSKPADYEGLWKNSQMHELEGLFKEYKQTMYNK